MALVDSKIGIYGLTCEPCRRRKIKCDKSHPCLNCVRHNILCSSQIRKKGRPTKFKDELLDRIPSHFNTRGHFMSYTDSTSKNTRYFSYFNSSMSEEEKRIYGVFLFCQSICKQKWSSVSLKIFQTIIGSKIAERNKIIYQMIQQKLIANGYDITTIENVQVTRLDSQELEFQSRFNEACVKQLNTVRLDLSQQKMICFRIYDNINHEVFFIINKEFHNFFFGGDKSTYKHHDNIIADVVHADYHRLFYSYWAAAILNLRGQSDVIIQCMGPRKSSIPCQATFRVLSLCPKGITCYAIEFQPLVPRHATFILDEHNMIPFDINNEKKMQSNGSSAITDLLEILMLQQKKTIENIQNFNFIKPFNQEPNIPKFINYKQEEKENNESLYELNYIFQPPSHINNNNNHFVQNNLQKPLYNHSEEKIDNPIFLLDNRNPTLRLSQLLNSPSFQTSPYNFQMNSMNRNSIHPPFLSHQMK